MPSNREKTLTTSPGPKTYPLVGSIPELLKDPFNYFFGAQREFGDVFPYRIGSRPLYFVAHPDDIKHVLLDNYKNYRKHTAYDKIKPLVGEGLLTSEGETWLANRRLAQPVFHRQRIAAFGTLMTDECETMMARWEQFGVGEAFDVSAEMMRLTLTVVGKALFSTDLSLEADEIGDALSFALEETNRRNLAPFSLPSSLPTPNNVRYAKAIQALDDVVYGLIAERRNSHEDKGDLLSMLLNVQDADTSERMSDKGLRDEAMTLFLAGHETSATALSWTFYLLSKHPAVQNALFREVDQTLEGRTATVADVPKLTYTRQVVDEALRLYPPAWMIGRHTLAEDRLPSGALLNADTDVSISPYVTHRHPDFWHNPEGFDPERFAPNENKHGVERHRFAYFPFGAGPRICIGNNFALLEMVLTLATVSQRYALDLVGGERGAMQPKITLRPKDGIYVTLSAR